MAKKG